MARNLLALGSVGDAMRSFAGALSTTEPLLASALILEREIKAQLSRSGTGKLSHGQRAAAPGQPPARQKGELLASIGHRKLKGRRREKIRVGTRLLQAPALEYGTVAVLSTSFKRRGRLRQRRLRKGSLKFKRRTVPPHPFMRPALAIAKPAMIEAFRITLKAKGTRQLLSAAERRAARARPSNPWQGFALGGFD